MNYNVIYDDERNKDLLRTLNDTVFNFRKLYGNTQLTRRLTNVFEDEYFPRSSCNRDRVCNTIPETDSSVLKNFRINKPLEPIGNIRSLSYLNFLIQNVIDEINASNDIYRPLYIPVNRTNNLNVEGLKNKLEECMES